MRPLRNWLPLCTLALVAGGLVGCELWPAYDDAGQVLNPLTTTQPISDMGRAIHELYSWITWLTIIIFVVVWSLLFYTLYRFRDQGQETPPKQIHGNAQAEVGWTLIPVFIVISIAIPTVRTIFELGDAAPEGALEVRAIGKQWWWAFEYPELGITTANELHLPVGRPVSVRIESDNVIHSFWIPRIAGKRDAVPGRINRMWFTIDEDIFRTGAEQEYGFATERIRAECAEYCGEAHGRMRFDVVAHEGDGFAGWVKDMKEGSPIEDNTVRQEGEAAFTAGACIGCHAIEGTNFNGNIGPDLTDFGDRIMLASGSFPNTEEHLRQWLEDPEDYKPGTPMKQIKGQLTDEQIDDLIAYLHALQ